MIFLHFNQEQPSSAQARPALGPTPATVIFGDGSICATLRNSPRSPLTQLHIHNICLCFHFGVENCMNRKDPKLIWSPLLPYADYYWYVGDQVKNDPLSCLPILYQAVRTYTDMQNNKSRFFVFGISLFSQTDVKRTQSTPEPHPSPSPAHSVHTNQTNCPICSHSGSCYDPRFRLIASNSPNPN